MPAATVPDPTTHERCPGCGLVLPRVSGATDPYAGASPSCWAMYGEVLARDFGDYRYPPSHRGTVDAYMAQHPGYATAAGRRSVVAHLVGLCLSLETDLPREQISPTLGRVFPGKPDVAALLPVPEAYAVTVEAVHRARDLAEQGEAVDAWARAVWEAWAPCHDEVRRLAEAVRAAPAARRRS